MVIEGEVISSETTRDIALVPPNNVVSLAVSVTQALSHWQEYQDLTLRLLKESDYQDAGSGKKFKKKSAWRKYANAFNISDHVSHEEIIRADDGFPLYARIRVTAVHPNGRTAEADHECHLSERCCPAKEGQHCYKETWQKHTCCLPTCNGRIHWSHPGDVPATALTRAKNRAISDLIGAGEVSAEEVEGQTQGWGQGDNDAPDGDTGPSGQPLRGPPLREVQCKFCNGDCYDNRQDKRSPNGPDFKCKKGDGVAWVQPDGSVNWSRTAR